MRTGMIANLPRMARGWSLNRRSKALQFFPLALTGDQGNMSSSSAPHHLQEILSELNQDVGLPQSDASTSPAIRHLHTQVYHRSRVTLRRTRLVQDMSLGLFTPRIALRHHPSTVARATRRRILESKGLGSDGHAAASRFQHKLQDAPLGVRYETMIIVNMDELQEEFKHAKYVEIVRMSISADQIQRVRLKRRPTIDPRIVDRQRRSDDAHTEMVHRGLRYSTR